jgi:hypothetical protein
MKLGATKILLTESKSLGKTLIGDGEGLALEEPMESPCLATDVEICIKLSDHFFTPITVDPHNGGHSLGMTNINGFIDRRNVERPKDIPIDRFHIDGHVVLAKNHGLIPIHIKLKPKTDIRIKFLLPKSGIGVPFLVHIVRPPCVVHHPEDAHHTSWTRRS